MAVTLRSDPVSLAPLTADATGRVVGAIAIPPGTALGDHTLQLSGRDTAGAVRTVTIGVTVTAQGSSTSTTAARALPRTGSSTGDRALAAAALIGVGMVLLGNGMGRRASRSSAR